MILLYIGIVTIKFNCILYVYRSVLGYCFLNRVYIDSIVYYYITQYLELIVVVTGVYDDDVVCVLNNTLVI